MVKLNYFSMKTIKALENCIRVLALPVLEVFHGQYTVLFFPTALKLDLYIKILHSIV